MPHHRSSSSSPFLSPPLLIIILPIIVLLLLFFALPPFLSFTSQLLRPTSVKKSWDSINILFVLFAILCGLFAKRNDEDSASSEDVETARVTAVGYEKSVEREDGSVSRQWYGFLENKIYDPPPIVRLQSPITTGASRLRRSSSSYPDLRQESLWETKSDRYQYRFLDDFEIDKFRSPEREQIPVDNLTPKENVGGDADVKEIQVDTIEIRSSKSQPPQPAPNSPTPPPTPPPPPPPPPAAARPKSMRTYQTVPRKEKLEDVNVADNDITMNPSPPQPPSPPAPSVQTEWEHKRGRNQRRKSAVKREIAVMWASLSNQKKRRRKQRTTTKVDYIHNEDNVIVRQPPPPPPPPPPSVFHSWFKKGVGKNKKIHSVSTPPPPAPPPPPPLTSCKRWSFRKPKIPPPPPPPPPPPAATEPLRRRSTGKPPLPTRKSALNNETLLNSGNESPLIPIPPPPPPPFKIPDMKFTVRGDFVRIRSTNSSRCGSPEPEEDPKAIDDPPEMEMGGTISCPSPDVNVKAATFIARLRGEWKLEKINSMKEKQNLGHYCPGPLRNYD